MTAPLRPLTDGRLHVPTLFRIAQTMFRSNRCTTQQQRPLIPMAILTLLLSLPKCASGQQELQPPNILLILADDLAWSDCRYQGHPYHETPHIDRLAGSGVVFTQAYAPAPICSASRASILTGKTPARLGFEFVTKSEAGHQQIDAPTKLQAPPFTLNLPLAEVTFAEHLQASGYRTAFFGKWHLNAHHGGYLGWSPEFGPARQGFEVAVDDFGAHPYAWRKQPPETIDQDGQFPQDALVDHICDFLSDPHAQPYVAMASLYYVHTPVKSQCSWLLKKYEDLVPEGTAQRSNRVRYAAFVETLDHHVGQILQALQDSGQADNTLVVFTSDNGGHPEYAANAPLRGSKWNLYEGGIRVPMIFSWPAQLPAGVTCEQPVAGYDLYATFAAASGIRLQAGSSLPETDGRNLLTQQGGRTKIADPSPRDLIWHFPYYHPERGYQKAPERIGVNDFRTSRTKPHSALRRGRHKLLYFYEDDRVELYDLAEDRSEQHDLSRQSPALARQLKSRLLKSLKKRQARLPKLAAPVQPAQAQP